MKSVLKAALLLTFICISLVLLASCKSKPSTFDYEIVNGEAHIVRIRKSDMVLFVNPEDVIIPDTIDGYAVAGIKDGAFSNVSSVHSVHIPKGVLYIEEGAFETSEGIKRFTVAEDNPNYKELGGDLYTKDGKVLIQYALNKDSEERVFTLPEGVERIANGAFRSASLLESVVLPSGLRHIGDRAFYRCTRLFSITFPDSLVSLGERAFESCWTLPFVSFGKSFAGIGDYAFHGCDKLAFIYVSEENASFASFGGVLYSKEGKTLFVYPPALGVGASYEVKEGTQSIANGAFCKSGIKSITLPDGLLEIGEDAFKYSTVSSAVIPDSVTKISKGAFCYAGNLTDVKLGEGVEYIGEYAFRDTDISSVLIPASVSFIGKCAFCGCSNLSMILVSEENPEYRSIDGNLYTKDGKVFLQYSLGSEAESFIITDGVREISTYAFFEADNLKSLTLPESVVKIGKSAFVSSSLESLVIPRKDGWVAKVDLDDEGENIDPQDLSSPEKCVENLVKSKWNFRHLERKTR